ncbi:hypothetical protein ACFOD4_09920 [Pseudoroseomonas globiformis]|uniref:Uncharacterized protein n=1 Tax=Teichococcus globiformis TaxID=2307229 RepID=A0ABV7G1B2_9PROT
MRDRPARVWNLARHGIRAKPVTYPPARIAGRELDILILVELGLTFE